MNASTSPEASPEAPGSPGSPGVSPTEPPRGPARQQTWPPPARTALRGLHGFWTALSTPAGPRPGALPPAREPGRRGRERKRARGRFWAYALVSGLVAVLIPVTSVVLTEDYGLPGPIAVSLAFAQAGPLLLAVTRPLQAWWVVITADTAGAVLLLFTPAVRLAWPWPPMEIIGYLVLCLALALRERRSTLIAVWTVTLVLSLGLGFLAQARSDGTNVLLTVLSGVVLLIFGAVRERKDAQRRLAEQETISEAERAGRTLLEERARIARELHDVVAHHMSVITVQADSAPYRLSGLPPEAREEFGSIAGTARESLSEMRRLMGVLRSEEAKGERMPQPGLGQLGQLVEATVRAGAPAELTVDKELHGLPQAVQLSVYRIVQEALANVVRHAPGAPARVSVTAADDGALAVVIVNDRAPGPAGPPLEATGTGHGLVGMRERVRLVGGALETRPLPHGGFRVAARIPLTPGTPDGKDATRP